MFRFRPVTSEDFPLLLEWISKSHIKEWWDDGDDTLEKVALHYGEKSDEVERFILVKEKDNTEKPVGYFQYYPVPDGTIGIDQFIGEEDYLNKSVGEKTIKMFVELIIHRHKTASIILDPSPDNLRAIRCYEKVGFKHYETVESENGQSAYMMRLEMPASI